MRKKTAYIVVVAAMLFVGGLLLVKGDLLSGEVPVERGRVQAAVHLAADYLKRNTLASGMFRYRVNLTPSVKLKKKYNILRHAGALFAMATYYRRHPDGETLAAIKRAGKYLKDEAVLPVAGEEDMSAVWSRPEVNGTGKPRQAKLGATGIGLVALMSIEQIVPGFTSMETLRQLGRFVVRMQKADGDFYSKYLPDQGGFYDKWRSLYYPGEAALGLMMLYRKDPSEVWVQTATRALTYLAGVRKGEARVPADHWALLATERIVLSGNGQKVEVPREALIQHASQICASILEQQQRRPKNRRLAGGFTFDGRTTPTATRLEGLQAALAFLPRGHALRGPVERAVERGMAFLLATQVEKGPFSGAIPRAALPRKGKGAKVEKFNRRASEVRIDYVQHFLSAAMQYLDHRKP